MALGINYLRREGGISLLWLEPELASFETRERVPEDRYPRELQELGR